MIIGQSLYKDFEGFTTSKSWFSLFFKNEMLILILRSLDDQSPGAKSNLFLPSIIQGHSDQTVLIKADNTTCVAYINHPRSNNLSRSAELLWKLCLERKTALRVEHIPGLQNVIADQASWLKADRNDWQINPAIFKIINNLWGPFKIDLFANQMNALIPIYYSWSLSESDRCICQSWNKEKFVGEPSLGLIPRTPAKVIRYKATMTIITPYWGSAPSWWTFW